MHSSRMRSDRLLTSVHAAGFWRVHPGVHPRGCIQGGCIHAAAEGCIHAAEGGACRGVHPYCSRGMHPEGGASMLQQGEGVSMLQRKGVHPECTLPLCGQTDGYENTTFAHTSYAVGNRIVAPPPPPPPPLEMLE